MNTECIFFPMYKMYIKTSGTAGSPEVSPVGRLGVFLREIPVRPARRLGAEHDPGVVLLERIHNLRLAVGEMKRLIQADV